MYKVQSEMEVALLQDSLIKEVFLYPVMSEISRPDPNI